MKKIDLTKGKVITVLTGLSLPIMGSSLLQFTYNLVDMLWVGALGSDAVASIGSSSFFIGLGYAINSLVITGTSIKVAHAIGRNHDDEVKKYINSGLFINTVIGLIYSLSLILFGKNLIGFLRLNNEIVERDAYLYLALNAPTMIFTFYNILYSKIMGSFGNNKVALKVSAIGIVINIILDPICIYLLNMGVLGAAIATLVANIIMFLLYQKRDMKLLRYNFKIPLDYFKIKEIITLGIPMSLQRILFTFINIILARIIAKFGSDAIAAQKIGLQIESITYMVIGGLSGAISSFTGQNFGAKKYSRIIEGYNIALFIGIIYSFIMAVIFIFFNNPIIKLFIRDNSTIIIAVSYLQIVALSQILVSVEMVSNGLFTGLGMPQIPAIISVTFTILRIPLSLVLINFVGLNGIWISISLSSIFKGVVSYLIYRVRIRKEFRYVKDH